MSAKFDKGVRVAVLPGKQGGGMRGEVFWIGESRYGKGARYGVRGDDGETYWVDEDRLGPEDAVPPPELPEATGEPLGKGTRVQISRGDHAGQIGEVFWVGESRYGKGPRYGVKADDGETYWVDGPGVEPLGEGAPGAAAGEGSSSSKPSSGASRPKPSRSGGDAAYRGVDEGSPFDDADFTPSSQSGAGTHDDAPLPDDADLAMPEDDGGFFDDEDVPF